MCRSLINESLVNVFHSHLRHIEQAVREREREREREKGERDPFFSQRESRFGGGRRSFSHLEEKRIIGNSGVEEREREERKIDALSSFTFFFEREGERK